jgi:hypothetical protein
MIPLLVFRAQAYLEPLRVGSAPGGHWGILLSAPTKIGMPTPPSQFCAQKFFNTQGDDAQCLIDWMLPSGGQTLSLSFKAG